MNKRVGFYLHTSWEYDHPFAARSWSREDYAGWWKFLRFLGVDLVMLWPMCEIMPAPLSGADVATLQEWRQVIGDAHSAGLECWVTQTANCTTRPEIGRLPFKKRPFYPYRIEVRLDDEAARQAFLLHRTLFLEALSNADGFVTIDGDPGSYPGAAPKEFLDVLEHDRRVLDALGRTEALVIPWIWCGWGCDWQEHGAWNQALEPLTVPLLELLKSRASRPRTFLPGRSMREGWANGRSNFEMVERAGLIEESVLLCYEIIEYEPTPPAVVIQFDDIRRVLGEEASLMKRSRGVMGNAQQPIMALPNLYFFARCARDSTYMQRSDEEVLRDFAEFLGGDPALICPAWQCLTLAGEELPAELPRLLRQSRLSGEPAQCLPGGPDRYLEILAAFVEVRQATLHAASLEDETQALHMHNEALHKWWTVHHYTGSGESGTTYRPEYSHPLLTTPRPLCLSTKTRPAV